MRAEERKLLLLLPLLFAGLAAWLWIAYNPDTYAPPKRIQRIEIAP